MTTSAEFDVFVSYARADDVSLVSGDNSGWISTLCRYIGEEHARTSTEPLNLFFDREAIRDMDDWRHRIFDGLRTARVLLGFISPRYFQSEYCRLEFEVHRQHQIHRQLGQVSIATVHCAELSELNATDGVWRDEVLRFQSYANATPWLRRSPPRAEPSELQHMASHLYNVLRPKILSARRAARAPTNLMPPTPHFLGRSTELRELHEKLARSEVAVTVCVYGLGGQGKSELAAAYAFGFASEYAGGAWMLNATGATAMLPLIAQLAVDLGLSPVETPQESESERGRRVLVALKARVEGAAAANPGGRARCLLILDNVSEPALLATTQLDLLRSVAATLAAGDWLHVIATTRLGPDDLPAARLSQARRVLSLLALDALPDADAAELIRRHATPSRFDGASDSMAISEIVHELGGFTLAIESVAVYLALNPDVSPADYLARLRAEGLTSTDALVQEDQVAAEIRHREKQLAVVLDATLATLTPLEKSIAFHAALLPAEHVAWNWIREAAFDGDAVAKPGYTDPWEAARRKVGGLRLITTGAHTRLRANASLGRCSLVGQGSNPDRLSQALSKVVVKSATDALHVDKPDSGTLRLMAALEAVADQWIAKGAAEDESLYIVLADWMLRQGSADRAIRFAASTIDSLERAPERERYLRVVYRPEPLARRMLVDATYVTKSDDLATAFQLLARGHFERGLGDDRTEGGSVRCPCRRTATTRDG